MRISRVLGAVVVGGAITFGSIAPAAAGDLIDLGRTHDGGQVDVLERDHPNDGLLMGSVLPVDGGLVKVNIGGPAPTTNPRYGLGGLLSKPLPLKVCVLCYSQSQPQPT
jgi:hypothetical protein